MSELRIPPNNIKSEEYILGCMLVDIEKIDQLANIKPEYFYKESHALILKTIKELVTSNKRVDIISVADELEKKGQLQEINGVSYLASLINGVVDMGSKSFETHLEIIKENWKLREIIKKCSSSVYFAYANNKSSEIVTKLFSDVMSVNSENIEKTSIIDNLEEYTNKQEQYAINLSEGIKTIGVPTGFRNLDRLLDGYQPEHLITISAGSSVGKSTMAMNMVHELLKQGKRVVVFSLEMSKADMIAKILGIHLNMNPKEITKGYGNENVYSKQKPAKAWLSMQRLVMYSELDNFEEIAMAMRNEESKEHVDLFVLDYLQNVSSDKYRDEYGLLTNAVKVLQRTNKNLKTTLLMLSQVSIETKKTSATQTVEGKGSGAIKNASDIFIYIKRDVKDEEEVNNIIQNGSEMPLLCVVNKNRHESIGAFKLNMVPSTGVIYEPY